MRLLFILTILGTFSLTAQAQSFRELNNNGVDAYKNKKYQDAEILFRKGIGKDSANFKGYFNLGDAYFKQGKNDEAATAFKRSLEKAATKDEKAKAYYNLGNSLLKSEKYQESVDAYKNSLKQYPSDKDAKYNLAYAQRMLKQQQQQQQQNKDNKNDKNQQNKDQNKQDQNKNDQQKKDQDKQKQDQQNQQDKKDQQQQDKQKQPQGGQQPKIKKEDAERMLEALKNNEKDLQKKLKKKVGVRVKTDKDW